MGLRYLGGECYLFHDLKKTLIDSNTVHEPHCKNCDNLAFAEVGVIIGR